MRQRHELLDASILAAHLFACLSACQSGEVPSSKDPAAVVANGGQIASTTPRPTERALREHIDSIVRGEPNFEQLEPDAANAVRAQPQLFANVARLGAVQSMVYRGPGPTEGTDRYEVTSEHGFSEWRIGLGPDGNINLLSVRIGEKPEKVSGNATPGQQVADDEFAPALEHPAFDAGKGPIVLVDEAHHNFHTTSGRYRPFARLLTRDGYVVNGTAQRFDGSSLQKANVLVIANAVGARNEPPFSKPISSAFDDAEIGAVHAWVKQGGSLLLIVDHFPWPDAARKLAEAFGIHFDSGIAGQPGLPGPLVFRRADQSLAEHPITRGRTKRERIQEVATFTGSAFKVDAGAALMKFVSPQAVSTTPKSLGRRSPDDTRAPIQGWLQGAALHVEKGRVAVFGEAAMFSAQRVGAERATMGMNHPAAKQNAQFLLNVMHWLSGLLDRSPSPHQR